MDKKLIVKKFFLCISFAMVFLLTALIYAADKNVNPDILFESETGFSVLNPPMAFDINTDGICEIILTDVEGRFGVFSGADGKKLWAHKIDSLVPTSPVVGNFLGNNIPCIAFSGNNGKVYLYYANTGREISVTEVGGKFNIIPTVINAADKENGNPKDSLALSDTTGKVSAIEFDGKTGAGKIVLQYTTNSQIDFPLISDKISGSTGADIIAFAKNGDIISNSADQQTVQARYSDRAGSGIRTNPVTLDINSDGKKEIILMDNKNSLNTYSMNGQTIELINSDRGITLEPIVPLSTFHSDIENTNYILIIGNHNVALYDSIKKRVYLEIKGVTNSGFRSSPSLFTDTSNENYMAISDSGNYVYLINLSKGTKTKETAFQEGLGRTSLVFNYDQDGNGAVIFYTEKTSKLIGYKTGLKHKNIIGENNMAGAVRYAWLCEGGNPTHNGSFDNEYAKIVSDSFIKSANEKTTNMDKAKQAYSQKQWKAAIEQSDLYLMRDSQNPEIQNIRHNAKIRKNLLPIILLIIMIAAGIIFIVYRFAFVALKIIYIKKAHSLAEMEKLQEAIKYYRKIIDKEPGNKIVCMKIVSLLDRIEKYAPEDIRYFENAYEYSGKTDDFKQSLAKAYSSNEITNDKSLEIYLSALDLFEDMDKSRIEFLIGKCYQDQNHFELAAKYLRSAIRGNPENISYYDSLTDIYLDMKFHTVKALQVFEKVYPQRMNDIRFLEALVESYIDAKKINDNAKTACLQVISKNPNFVPAYAHLANINIQTGNIKEATEYVNKILVIDPQNSQGYLLLSNCYLIDGRQDAKALDVYLKCLRNNFDNPDVLKMVSQIYFYQKKFDEEAKKIYFSTWKYFPNDIAALFGLSKVYETNPDHDVIIPVVEKLIELGQAKSFHYLQLARSYAVKTVITPNAEKIYKEALKQEPENADFIVLLARTMKNLKKDDAEAASYYEKAIKLNKADFEIGKQLAITYCKLGRYAQASKLSQDLLKIKANDDDLKRNYALANLHDNKLDEAITEYKTLIEKDHNDKEAIVNLAIAYAHKRNLDQESIATYQKALTVAPDNEDLHMIMAYTHLKNNNTAGCIQELNAALKSKTGIEAKIIERTGEFISEFPEELKIRWFLISLFINTSRLREAIQQLEEVFELNSDEINNIVKAYDKIIQKDNKNAIAYLNRGIMHKILNNYDLSRKNLETAYEIMPNSIDIQTELRELYEFLLEDRDDNETRFKLGKLYYLSGDFDKAIGCFQKTGQNFKWESESYKMLGKCFVGKGMLDLALQEFKKLVVDEEIKDLFYDLAQRFEEKKDLVGAKTVYKILFAADINYKNVKSKFEMLAGSTSDPMTFEKTAILSSLSEATKRRYQLIEEVGRGAMGIVYKAKDKELDEIVALKILPDSLSNNPEAISRFKAEARSARRLSHKNIVRIHDIGEELGRKYISMEFVDGIDLKKKLRTEKYIDIKTTVEWGRQIAEALAYAHSIGIIHRDIKPANIMITKESIVKITDFGIAKLMEGGESTVVGAILGTPIYMSPEQVQGLPVDNRADIYSYGIMMYEMYAKTPPFVENLAYNHMHTEPPQLPDAVPEALQNIIMKCLKKKREDRWKTAEEISIHLAKLKESL